MRTNILVSTVAALALISVGAQAQLVGGATGSVTGTLGGSIGAQGPTGLGTDSIGRLGNRAGTLSERGSRLGTRARERAETATDRIGTMAGTVQEKAIDRVQTLRDGTESSMATGQAGIQGAGSAALAGAAAGAVDQPARLDGAGAAGSAADASLSGERRNTPATTLPAAPAMPTSLVTPAGMAAPVIDNAAGSVTSAGETMAEGSGSGEAESQPAPIAEPAKTEAVTGASGDTDADANARQNASASASVGASASASAGN